MKYSKIKTVEQYQQYLDTVETLRSSKKEKNQEEIELLDILLDEYQNRQTGAFYSALNPVELLRLLLHNDGISQNQLAEELEISKQLLSDILNYRRNISKMLVLKLSAFFSVPQELFSKKYNLKENNKQMKHSRRKFKKDKLIEKDDLTKIEGVNDTIQNKLNAADIYTYENLSKASESEINLMVNEPESGYVIDVHSLKSQSAYAATIFKNKINKKKENFKDKIPENMSLKDRIKHNLELISNPGVLNEILNYILPFTTSETSANAGNVEAVLAFAGSFSEEDANGFLDTINSEFNKIDDEW